ncbi:unnamed protein product [Enterobius vermicularis]|uniref:LRAT domain-containing protein n=1 Tax=Enterobius vermicularis TaxID=51028 RepID=A0A0N4UZ26_ENTVE|nr:unnamed protein product [Enterobius vermicularis]
MMLPGELVTDWLRWQDLKPLLEIGDLIEFRRVAGTIKRRIYTNGFDNAHQSLLLEYGEQNGVVICNYVIEHWAVCIAVEDGKLYVAHLSLEENDFEGPSVSCTDSFAEITTKIMNGSKAEVRRDELSHVAREDLCRINNSLDCQCSPLPPSVIVERALMKLGTGDYNLLFNNCEHFVKYCRYGEPESDQVSFKAHLVTFKITSCICYCGWIRVLETRVTSKAEAETSVNSLRYNWRKDPSFVY